MYTFKIKITKEKVSEIAFNWLLMDDLITERERELLAGVSINSAGDMVVEFDVPSKKEIE